MKDKAADEVEKTLDYMKGYFEGVADSRLTVLNDLKGIAGKLRDDSEPVGFQSEADSDK